MDDDAAAATTIYILMVCGNRCCQLRLYYTPYHLKLVLLELFHSDIDPTLPLLERNYERGRRSQHFNVVPWPTHKINTGPMTSLNLALRCCRKWGGKVKD